jgi:hypothetical protein
MRYLPTCDTFVLHSYEFVANRWPHGKHLSEINRGPTPSELNSEFGMGTDSIAGNERPANIKDRQVVTPCCS